MFAHLVLKKAATALASGVAGALVVDSVKRGAGGRSLRSSAVTVTAWGLRGRRSAEAGAESVRLATGDIVAQARARVGEQAPPPQAATNQTTSTEPVPGTTRSTDAPDAADQHAAQRRSTASSHMADLAAAPGPLVNRLPAAPRGVTATRGSSEVARLVGAAAPAEQAACQMMSDAAETPSASAILTTVQMLADQGGQRLPQAAAGHPGSRLRRRRRVLSPYLSTS